MPYEGPGRYRHYKGGTYEVVGIALAEADPRQETLEVIYRPVNAEDWFEDVWPTDVPEADFWRRPLKEFDAPVLNPDAQIAEGSRFKLIERGASAMGYPALDAEELQRKLDQTREHWNRYTARDPDAGSGPDTDLLGACPDCETPEAELHRPGCPRLRPADLPDMGPGPRGLYR